MSLRNINSLREILNNNNSSSYEGSYEGAWYVSRDSPIGEGNNHEFGNNGDYWSISNFSGGPAENVYKKNNGIWESILWSSTVELNENTGAYKLIKAAEANKRHIVLTVIGQVVAAMANQVAIGYGDTNVEIAGTINVGAGETANGTIMFTDEVPIEPVYDYPFHNKAWNVLHIVSVLGATNKNLAIAYPQNNPENEGVFQVTVTGITI